jgi:hypothetical protein
MNIKIIIILVIITLIISSVIIYAIKKDTGIDSFFVIDRSIDSNLPLAMDKTPILKMTYDTDIWVILKLKNPGKGENYKLVVYYNGESDNEILQTNKISIKEGVSQIIEVSILKKGNQYQKGIYFVKLYHNELLEKEIEFEII